MTPKNRTPGSGGDSTPGKPGDGTDGSGGKRPLKVGDVDATDVSDAHTKIEDKLTAGRQTEGGGTTPGKGDDTRPGEQDDTPPQDSSEAGDPYDGLTPEQQRAAKDELIDDSNKNFRLTEQNAEAALRSGPPGSTPEVAGPGGSGADVKFHDEHGDIVGRTEVKSIDGGQNSFNKNLSHAAEQVQYDGQVRIQVKEGTDVESWMATFQGRRTDEQLAKYENVEVVFSDPNGRVLGTYNVGTRLNR